MERYYIFEEINGQWIEWVNGHHAYDVAYAFVQLVPRAGDAIEVARAIRNGCAYEGETRHSVNMALVASTSPHFATFAGVSA